MNQFDLPDELKPKYSFRDWQYDARCKALTKIRNFLFIVFIALLAFYLGTNYGVSKPNIVKSSYIKI